MLWTKCRAPFSHARPPLPRPASALIECVTASTSSRTRGRNSDWVEVLDEEELALVPDCHERAVRPRVYGAPVGAHQAVRKSIRHPKRKVDGGGR
jgi:hypothetical protein